MKKILALVLALVMTLSLATISSGAAYSDADSIRYADAVNTLTALGVVQGTGTGFDPAGDVTRGAAAKMVAMVATGSSKTTLSYYAGTSAFADVPATNVFADSVAFCVARGIVDGYGNGMYGVKDNVKGWAIAKMVLVAMGYDAEAYGLTGAGASLNTITLASTLGLFNGMEADFVATAAASREECAQIVYNALTLNGVKKGSVSSDGVTTYVASGKCLMQNYAWYANDAMTGVEDGVAWSNFGTPAIEWLELGMVDENQATGYWYTYDGWNLNVETGLDVVGHVIGYVPTTASMKEDAYGDDYFDVFAVVDLSEEVVVTTALSTEKAVAAAFGKTTALDGDIIGYKNYAVDGDTAPALDADEASVGTYVIYDGAVVSYLVNDFSVGYVEDYNAGTSKLDGNITVSGQEPYALITSDLSKEAGYTTMVSYYDGLAEGDVVIVQPCGDLTTITKAETVSGVVTAVATSKAAVPSITVGGKVYAKSSDYVASGLGLTLKGNLSSNMVNADVTMYLDPLGAVFAIMDTPDASNDAGLAYVVKTWTKETAGSYNEDAYVEYFVQAVDMTGAVVDYQTAPACDIETEGHVCDSSCDNYGGASVGDLMAVTTTYSDITKTTVANFAASSATGSKIVDDCNDDLTAYSLKFGDKDYFASDVKFIYVSGSGSTLKVTVKDGVQAVKTNGLDYYAVQVGTSENFNVKYVVVPAGFSAGAVTSTDVVYANETRASYESESYTDVNGDAQKAFVHYVYINGVYTKVLTAKSTPISGFKSYSIDANGLYVFKALNEKVATGVVSNLYGTLLTLDVEGLADIEAKDAKIVDTVYAAMTDAEKAAAEEITTLAQLAEAGSTVAVVYNLDATETYATDFVTIYVLPTPVVEE